MAKNQWKNLFFHTRKLDVVASPLEFVSLDKIHANLQWTFELESFLK